jgi:hypothetical protein
MGAVLPEPSWKAFFRPPHAHGLLRLRITCPQTDGSSRPRPLSQRQGKGFVSSRIGRHEAYSLFGVETAVRNAVGSLGRIRVRAGRNGQAQTGTRFPSDDSRLYRR